MADITPRALWTPSIFSGSGPGDLSVVYGAARLGVVGGVSPLVMIGFDIQFTPTYTSAPGTFVIAGLPPMTLDNAAWGGTIRSLSNFVWPAGTTQISPAFSNAPGAYPPNPTGGPLIILNSSGTGTAPPNFFFTNFPSGVAQRVSGSLFGLLPP